MPKEFVNPDSLFPSVPHGFSQVVIATGRKMVFISGQTAWDAQKKIVGADNLLEQAKQALRNLGAAMEAAGGSLKDVVTLRILHRELPTRERECGWARVARIFSGEPACQYLDRRFLARRS